MPSYICFWAYIEHGITLLVEFSVIILKTLNAETNITILSVLYPAMLEANSTPSLWSLFSVGRSFIIKCLSKECIPQR